MRPDLAPSNLLFFFNVFCGKWAWHPPDHATPLSFYFQIAEISSFLLMNRLFLYKQGFCQNIEKGLRIFFKMIQFSQSPPSNIISKKIFPLAFFNILTEPLLVQKQTIHQQKAWDLSYLEPEAQGPGMFRRVPRPLAAKDIEKKVNLTELSQDAKKNFFRFNF